VRGAIDFEDELSFKAGEIGRDLADGELTPELQAIRFRAQHLPEKDFGQAHLPSTCAPAKAGAQTPSPLDWASAFAGALRAFAASRERLSYSLSDVPASALARFPRAALCHR
jgi:hypothetical protein